MKFAQLTTFFVLALAISACSIYQSDGRKFLERGGLTFAKGAQSAYIACSTAPPTTAWVPLERTDQADVYSAENDRFEMQVAPVADTPYSCYYRFASAQEMFENTSGAIDHCLHQSPDDCPPELLSTN